MTICPDNVRPVILIGHVNKPLEKNLLITFQENKHLFSRYVFAC